MVPMESLPRLTFLGHSTVLIEVGGIRIVTDPVLFDRVGALRRVVTPLAAALYSGVDVVLLSHLHLDHFDLASLRILGPEVQLIVPAGAGDLLRAAGFARVNELGAGERIDWGSLSVTATEAVHGGFRPPFGPRAAAVGYLVEAGGSLTYFAGDTDVFPGMSVLAPDLDVALLPVWGWGPSLGPGHLDPTRAAEAVGLLRPRYAVPIHWGTLWPFGLGRVRTGRLSGPPQEFAARAAHVRPDTSILLTAPGTPVTYARSSVREAAAPE
jgi:L-ascorbate metabolism protein UlaG (beta-lactamase superfamily)